jgi:regulator of nonsense transcripts 1
MERLSSTVPEPVIVTAKVDSAMKDETWLNALPIRQARSLVQAWGASEEDSKQRIAYRKQFAGSLLLSVQYRMHPSIAAFSSAIFYDSLLSTPSFLADSRKFPCVLNNLLPCDKCGSNSIRMVNVGGRTNERRGGTQNVARTVFGSSNFLLSPEEQTTYRNEAEAICVVELVKEMVLRYDKKDGTFPASVGVVTPYNGQVKLIKSMLASDDQLSSLIQNIPITIEVNSVDGYQGRERDLIIFSAVRSNRSGKLGFLHDWRRMNVALTRARAALIVVGDLETLIEGDKHWAAFGKWCQGVHCIVDNATL